MTIKGWAIWMPKAKRWLGGKKYMEVYYTRNDARMMSARDEPVVRVTVTTEPLAKSKQRGSTVWDES